VQTVKARILQEIRVFCRYLYGMRPKAQATVHATPSRLIGNIAPSLRWLSDEIPSVCRQPILA
jgi:hypothetical protein